MVSPLWKACSEGDLQNVQDLLNDATIVDIEIKDHTGATPLIEAVKNGHLEIVRVLLDKGADPANASSQGRPELYTSDPAILELLNFAQNKTLANGIPPHEPVYTPESSDGHDKRYAYGPPPPIMYPYYPGVNPVPPPSDGVAYYPRPPPPQNPGENPPPAGLNNGNLPPPEVARLIPCRYFPACRYGATCIFAHPQTPYYQGPVPPPAQYAPPYDPMNVQPYRPGYYPPPPFQPPTNPPHIAPLPPTVAPHSGHTRSPSEAILPVQVPPFSPNGVHPTVPYGSISPSAYPHPGHPPVPMSISPLPSLPPQSALPTPSPSNLYNTVPPPIPPFVPHDAAVPYPVPQPSHPNIGLQDVIDEAIPPVIAQPEVPSPNHPPQRDGLTHHRRGGPRRASFGGRKPPCLFFPAGRCKNGDDCRFPHVILDGSGPHHQPFFSGRGGRPRHANGNGFAAVNEKLASMTIRGDHPDREDAGHPSSDSTRPRYPNGHKNNHQPNGVRPDKRPLSTKQRVPNADEFPVLAGSVTPPSRNPGTNGVLLNGNGPTAAQVLQAPRPPRKDSSKESTPRGTTPDSGKPAVTKVEPNGVTPPAQTHDPLINRLPVSFAAAAASEMPKEIVMAA